MDDTILMLPHSQRQIGKGVPQYLCLLMHQSLAFSIQSFSLEAPAQSGYHLTFSFATFSLSLIELTLRNHWSVILYMMGFLHLQQCPYL